MLILSLVTTVLQCLHVQACTDGGCAVSNVSQAVTAESAPAGVQEPRVVSSSPTQLDVKCLEPLAPNGKRVRVSYHVLCELYIYIYI